MLTLILVFAIFLFFYPFLLYPVLLRLLAGKRRKPVPVGAELAAVSLVICALNEEKIIRQKIENSLELDYPAQKLEIVVVSDGSTDRTAEIVREYVGRGIVLIERKTRRGKIANLNEVIPSRKEEIVVLSDANVIYDREAIRHLVRNFSDPAVGCVSGKVILTDTTAKLNAATDQYYSLEWALQDGSSRLYSMAGADGAMFALRRSLFTPLPDDTLIEDFVTPIQIVRQGKRVVFEPKAVGWERGVQCVREEFRRKVRIAAGAAQAMIRGNGWPLGAPGSFWFIFLSHKLMRWLSPLFAAAAVVLACATIREPVSECFLAGVAGIGALAIVRIATGWNYAAVNSPFYFLVAQLAVAIGLFKGLAGMQSVLWKKADR